ncbi:MAG: hypothetical protein E7185_09880 [Erysipelotrichaceae bacterium]|nr:hypothetical protein [Erysipelotrichaceae bacterium]
MPYITSFVFCDTIERDVNNGKRIINPLTQLSPIALPGNYTFSYSISVADVDTHIDNNLKLIFTTGGESNQLLDINIPKDSIPLEEDEPVLTLDGEIRNYVFKKPGIAEMTLIINGETIQTQKIKIVLGHYE